MYHHVCVLSFFVCVFFLTGRYKGVLCCAVVGRGVIMYWTFFFSSSGFEAVVVAAVWGRGCIKVVNWNERMRTKRIYRCGCGI